jgi:putative inorganic carbon (HCO3(-)) transporter
VAAGLGALLVRWPWLVAVLALACVPVRIPVELGGETGSLLVPLYAVVAGATAALAWQLLRGDRRVRELGRLAWPLAAFLAWLGLSALWTDDLRTGAVTLLAFVLPFGVLAVSVSRLAWSRRWLGALYVQLTAMALVFAGVGVYQWVTRDVFWNPKVSIANAYAPFHRVNSVFWDPSIYGRFLVLAILASLVLAVFGASRRTVLAAAAAAAAAWVGLVFSFSQSSFFALIVCVLVVAGLAWRRRAAVALGLAVGSLVLVGFTSPQLRHALVEDVEDGLNRATSGRAGLVANGLRIAGDHPVLGVGVGGFRRAYAERVGLEGEAPAAAASHNAAVTVAAELGVPGFALLAWLLAIAVGLPLARASRSFAGRVSLIVALAVLAIFAHSLFYAAFFEDPSTWLLFGLGALVVAWRGAERRAAAA